jgi:membrane-associated HD superfamily phosphohydrolase
MSDENIELLRKQDIENRFRSLKDMRKAFHSLHDEANPELWLKNILESQKDHAETEISALEVRDNELDQDPVKKQKEFIQSRLDEYMKEGLTYAAVIEALWEKVMENRPEKAEAMIPIRERVKNKVPKK